MDHVKNAATRRKLLDALRSGNPIAVTGSGVSSHCGYGRWDEVIDRLADFAEICSPGRGARQIRQDNSANLVHAASALSTLVGNRLGEFMANEFGPKAGTLPELVVKLCSMGFAHFLTLNYDPSLELIHAALGRAYEVTTTADFANLISFMRSQTDRSVKHIVYLHGRYTDPPEMLAFTNDGYLSRYRSGDGIFRRFLWSTFVTNTLVFIGIGFNELQLNFAWWEMLGSLRNQDPPHFAIVGLPSGAEDEPIRNQYQKTYGVDPIFYEIKGSGRAQDHSEFSTLLLLIWNELGMVSPSIVGASPVATPHVGISANVNVVNKWTEGFVKKHGSGGSK